MSDYSLKMKSRRYLANDSVCIVVQGQKKMAILLLVFCFEKVSIVVYDHNQIILWIIKHVCSSSFLQNDLRIKRKSFSCFGWDR